MSQIKVSTGEVLNIPTQYVQLTESTPDDIVVVAASEELMITQVEEQGHRAVDGRHAVGWLDSKNAGGWYDGSSEDWIVQEADGNRLYTTERDPKTGKRLLLAAVRAGIIAAQDTAMITIGMAFPPKVSGEPNIFVPIDTTLHSLAHYWQVDGSKDNGMLRGMPVYQPLASVRTE